MTIGKYRRMNSTTIDSTTLSGSSKVSETVSAALLKAKLSRARDEDERGVRRSLSETTSSDASDVHMPVTATSSLQNSAAAAPKTSAVRKMAAEARSIAMKYAFNLRDSSD